MYSQLPRPAIFAHRGSSMYAPENTIAAFKLAISQNADAIELDAKCSADGEVVVIHDQTLERTTDGSGEVLDHPLDSLKELDAGSWFDNRFQGEAIPTLDEVFEVVGREIFINIELTNYASPRDNLSYKVVELVKRFGMNNNVLFSSFNPLAIRWAHKLLPDIPLGLLAMPGIGGIWARSWPAKFVPHQALHAEVGDTTPKLIRKQHKKGHRVHVWTVNAPEKMQQLFEMKVDGIFTDDPLLARQVQKRAAE